jgi:hypothetical protein
MPHDLILTPHLDDQRAAQLTRIAKHLDWQIDHPTGMPQPVAQSGLLESLGPSSGKRHAWKSTPYVRLLTSLARPRARCGSWCRANTGSICHGNCSTTHTPTLVLWHAIHGAF